MRDRSITNWFGENLDEQQKRRKWLENVYDKASSDNINLSDDNNNFQSQPKKQNPLQQITGAVGDLVKNYYDMRRDDTIGNDNYFHCKANFDATQRGEWGETTAKYLGDAKEKFDYYTNQRFKGLSQRQAYNDYLWDKGINQIGRQRAKDMLYPNAKEGCEIFRVKGINERY